MELEWVEEEMHGLVLSMLAFLPKNVMLEQLSKVLVSRYQLASYIILLLLFIECEKVSLKKV